MLAVAVLDVGSAAKTGWWRSPLDGTTSEHPPWATLDPLEFRSGEAQLLVWEAFVTGLAKDRDAEQPHISDARAAGKEFERRWTSGSISSDLGPEDCISLAGLALVVSGLRSDLDVLAIAPTVVRAPNLR